MKFNWQKKDLEKLLARRAQLPHALLLFGQKGIGKADLASFFVQSLLCEAPQKNGEACGQCAACLWFVQGSHPDFRLIRPDALAEATDEAVEIEGENTSEASAKDSKKASKEIRIDQIRALADFINLGSHRSGLRVVLLYPAQALNLNAANALLKMLEEPPPHTLFVLVSDGLDGLLPTILSRCQKIAIAPPETELALAWLKEQRVESAASLLAEAGGAPLLALALSTQSELLQAQKSLFHGLAQPQQMDALQLADKLYKVPLPTTVDWVQRWLHDLVAVGAVDKVRYYPAQQPALSALAGRITTQTLLGFTHQVTQFAAIATHPLNPRVQLEALLLQYQRLFADRAG